MIQDQICEALCAEIAVTEVPAGFAVSTPFVARDGDSIGFYLVRNPLNAHEYRIEDSGLTIPFICSSGASLSHGPRATAFAKMLSEHGVQFDDESMLLHTEYLREDLIARKCSDFMAMMLRVQDLELLTPEVVESTFRDDVKRELERALAGRAHIEYRAMPHARLSEFEADAVVTTGESSTLAIYFATSDERVNEAVLCWMENRHQKLGVKVAAILEREKPAYIANRTLRRAMNRLDSTTVFRGDEHASIERLSYLALPPAAHGFQ